MALWPIFLSCGLGLAGLCLVLPRAGRLPPLAGTIVGMAALVAAGWLLIDRVGPWPETVLFYAFAGMATVSGVMLVAQANPVHAALSFALVVLSTCGLFLLQAAPFLMAATIIVYAGAIVVTFLFVIMLAQQQGHSDADERSREPFLAALAGVALLAAILIVLGRTFDTRNLDALLGRLRSAQSASSVDETEAALGPDDAQFFVDLQREIALLRESAARSSLENEAVEVRSQWSVWKAHQDSAAMRMALARLEVLASKARDASGGISPRDPARRALSPYNTDTEDPELRNQNVAALGRMLFTEMLIPVELGGVLLLVATVGAVAITDRRSGKVR